MMLPPDDDVAFAPTSEGSDESSPDERSRAPSSSRGDGDGAGGDAPLSDLRGGHTERRIGNLVMQQLFDRAPVREAIGRYWVLDRIGRGGMGTVFAAYDDRLDRKIAIKLLGTTGGGSKAAALRLEREARAMARLSHPNVATVHEVGEADGQLFIAMEFIRGQDLEAWFESQPPWRAVLEAFLQAGRGILAAHEAGLVHRDLKPHNIMRTEDGTVKVLDFGLARADTELAEESSVTESGDGGANPLALDLTKTGAVLGTPAYMSPEQHRGELADARSDQFSFCVALFEGLYGTLPFEGPTLPELIERVLEHRLEPVPPQTRVPAWVHRIVVRGLSLEPQERWPSMRALLEALRRDPAQARRRWSTVGALAGATGLLGFGLAQLGAAVSSDCPTAGDEREALWSEERRARVEEALHASGSPLAADTLARTTGPIEAYVDALGRMRAASCEAHRAGRESPRLHDLRTACLDIRRAGMDQLLVQLESADASTVGNAAWAIASLPSVARCGDAVALTAGVAPPEEPEVARRTQHQREVLASVLSLAMTGSYDEAIARGEDARDEAESIGYEPLLAEAELTLGAVFMEAHQPDRAHGALSRGVRRGLRSMHHEVAVDALARRMWVLAEPLGRPEEALAIDEIAEAMLDHIDRPPVLHWRLLNNRAVAQFQAGAIDDAERSYHEALEVLAAEGEERHPVEGISTRFNLAMLQSEGLGRPDVAAQELLAARSQATELLGAEHPRVLMLDSFLAENLSLAGQLGRARVELEGLRERIPESDPYNRVLLLVELARVHYLLREHAAGLEVSEQALALATRALPDERVYAIARWHRGIARIGGGQLDEGIADLQGAVLHQREHAGPGTEALAIAHVWAGLGLRRAGRAEDAIEAFERGYAIAAALGASGRPLLTRSLFEMVDATIERGDLARADALLQAISRAQDEASFSADSQYRLERLQRRGALWSARGDRPKASDAYERACTGLARHYDAHHPALAGCRLAYAQARGTGDRARELARQAAEAYRALGEGFAAEEARARAFVATLAG